MHSSNKYPGFVCVGLFLLSTIGTSLAVECEDANVPEAEPVTKEQAIKFVEEQFAYYFTDCEKYVETYAKKFEYCDFAPPGIRTNPVTGCVSKEDGLLELCLATQGSPANIYQLDTVPSFAGLTPSYNEIAIKGFQKVTGVPFPDPVTGIVSIFDFCFDFVVVESLQAAPESELDVETSYWKGYFGTEFCGVPGLPACRCDSMTPIASYNFS